LSKSGGRNFFIPWAKQIAVGFAAKPPQQTNTNNLIYDLQFW
jgi:hypothetical protein